MTETPNRPISTRTLNQVRAAEAGSPEARRALSLRGVAVRSWDDTRFVVTEAHLLVALDTKTGHGAAYRLNSNSKLTYVGARDRDRYPGIWNAN